MGRFSSKDLSEHDKLHATVDASPEVEALRSALAAAEARAAIAEARASEARAMASGNEAVIATLKLEIEKLKRALYGQKSVAPRAVARPAGAAARGT